MSASYGRGVTSLYHVVVETLRMVEKKRCHAECGDHLRHLHVLAVVLRGDMLRGGVLDRGFVLYIRPKLFQRDDHNYSNEFTGTEELTGVANRISIVYSF